MRLPETAICFLIALIFTFGFDTYSHAKETSKRHVIGFSSDERNGKTRILQYEVSGFEGADGRLMAVTAKYTAEH